MQLQSNDDVNQMQALLNRDTLLERRTDCIEPSLLWDKLTLAQKFAASSLLQFGYELFYIRNQQSSKLAILFCNDTLATITAEGDVDSSPTINIRH